MTVSEPAAGPVDPVDSADVPATARFGSEPIRTSLKLRPEVHEFFRLRAYESKTSIQKLIESLCEGAYQARQATVSDRERRADRRTAKRKDTP